MIVAIPGCQLYVREVFSTIAKLTRSSRVFAKVEGNLRSDVEHWRFLDDWSDCLPWKSEQHCRVSLFSDASMRSWGGVLFKDGKEVESRDYWLDTSDDINSLEAKALLRSLLAFRDHIRDSRLDVYSDNLTLKAALDNFGCKSSSVNESVKKILECGRRFNFSINVHYVPSRDNLADGPSRVCSDLDCTLSEKAWDLVERSFGPHSFDLMSLDSNCRRDRFGRLLPHYSPWPTPASQGYNAFAQPVLTGHNIYVFPPFVLIGPLFRYFLDQKFRGALTLVVPDLRPGAFGGPFFNLLQSTEFCSARKIPRPWKPTRRCSSCLYPNDADANFCQACGVAAAPVASVSQRRDSVDEKAIQERFQSFRSSFARKPYQRQKSVLEEQLSVFLSSVSPPKTISSCTSDDIIRFLIHKDKSGRTVIHTPDCSGVMCQCPRRLAAGTIDSLLGKLRSIFNGLGRLDQANPIAHPRVKEYLKFVRDEQAAVNNRLRGYLVEAKLHDGETPHSFRVGLSNTLKLLGCSQEDVAQYIGWQSGKMASHYSRVSDTAVSLTILESVLPSAVGLARTPVSHPENLRPACNA
ncbi:hypothetical protein ACROYT_G001353 [Oculina patagonica]